MSSVFLLHKLSDFCFVFLIFYRARILKAGRTSLASMTSVLNSIS